MYCHIILYVIEYSLEWILYYRQNLYSYKGNGKSIHCQTVHVVKGILVEGYILLSIIIIRLYPVASEPGTHLTKL